MIELLAYINNIGRFESFTGTPDTALAEFTLVFSENGRGKTTLCSILRSLSTGEPGPIHARRRVSASGDPHAVVQFDGTQSAFDGRSWTAPGPRIFIFDDHFTDANVCSGLDVGPGHRKGLHELVVGEAGVRLQRHVQDLAGEIAGHQSVVRERERDIPAATLGTYALDEFCALVELEGIDDKIGEARKSAAVLRDAAAIQDTKDFAPLALPVLPTEEIEQVLGTVLPDLDSGALAAVRAHFAQLGDGSEDWASQGTGYMQGDECPFCDQDIDGATLVGHYRRYFSEEYAAHRDRIAGLSRELATNFGGDRLARFQRLVQDGRDRRSFWSSYIELPEFDVDSEVVATRWTEARDALQGAIDAKAATPLEVITLGEDSLSAIARYDAFAGQLRDLSAALLSHNEAVARAREHATHGSLPTAEAQLRLLEATKRRYEQDTRAQCDSYVEAKRAKAAAEKEKEEARAALDAHRAQTFGKYQAAINGFLVKLNADFRLEALAPSDKKGVPSSSYVIGVNKGQVPLASQSTEPSFRTALSSGDRNTLALALFFATLQEAPSLDDAIVVIDDPASSLDDGRRFATAQEIRGLVGKAQQVVVLSHSEPLLSQLWDRADKTLAATLEIQDVGADESTLRRWDADAAAVTNYDRLHALVRGYADDAQGDPQHVAPSLRLLLEAYLRVAFIGEFPPGGTIWDLICRARQAEKDGAPFLAKAAVDELDKLREYANQFHHNTDKNWQENLANVNLTALKGYAGRVVSLVGSSYSASP